VIDDAIGEKNAPGIDIVCIESRFLSSRVSPHFHKWEKEEFFSYFMRSLSSSIFAFLCVCALKPIMLITKKKNRDAAVYN